MSQAHEVRITVHIAPSELTRGQMVQVSAAITDRFGAPVVVPTLFMEILDSTGREYWPLTPIARNVSSFAKLISTTEMRHNTRYIVRVTTNKKLSPQGYDFFKLRNEGLHPAFIPLLFAPAVLIPGQLELIPKEARKPIFATYRTELDERVCPICKPNEGLVFAIDDPKIIRIGPSELGGQTHYGCRCHYDLEYAVNAAVAKVQRQLRAARVVMIVNAIQKHKVKN